MDSIGFEMIAITPDPPEKMAETRAGVGLTFKQLSDPEFVAAKAFGVAFLHNGKRPLPVPSIFVVAPNRVIRFTYINPDYRVRLDDEVLLAMVRSVAREFEIGR